MINESEGEEGGALEGEEGGLDHPGVIQVSPQDKEAIERVGCNFFIYYYYSFLFYLLFCLRNLKKTRGMSDLQRYP